ncbi:MAG: DUF4878 domain-containing protein [Candidatus Eremiobacteraeota bacterium]|nr:DUF4878 domain-containing protein [Candidatus Eremiobacteraeota bacterium]
MKKQTFAFICLVVLAVLFTACAKKAASPTDVMNGALKAILAGNVDKAWEAISEASRANFKSKDQFRDTMGAGLLLEDTRKKIESIKIIGEKIEGSKGTLTIEYLGVKGQPQVKEMECVLEGNQWKIDIQPLIHSIME